MTRLITLAFICISVIACSQKEKGCQYTVTSEYVETNCSLLSNGFYLDRIDSVLATKDERPEKYTFNREISLWFLGNGDTGFKKVWYHKAIPGYKWYLKNQGKTSDTIPYEFEKGRWYLMSGLFQADGVPSIMIFIRVNNDGSFETFRKDSLNGLKNRP